MNISDKSWHYRLYSRYWNHNKAMGDSVNLCPYLRGVFMGFIMACLITGVFFALTVAVLEPIAILIMWLISGVFLPDFFGPGGGLILYTEATLLALLVLYLIGSYLSWSVRKLNNAPGNNFTTLVSAGYRSIHDKVCPTITVEKE